jgi:hypothetical protein
MLSRNLSYQTGYSFTLPSFTVSVLKSSCAIPLKKLSHPIISVRYLVILFRFVPTKVGGLCRLLLTLITDCCILIQGFLFLMIGWNYRRVEWVVGGIGCLELFGCLMDCSIAQLK